MVNDIAVQEFVDAIKEQPTDTNKTYVANVARIDAEGVVWVNLEGSQKETPTASVSTEVERGDLVNVEWRNNKLYIASNVSNPSAGVIRVANVEQAASEAWKWADSAHQAADEAWMWADSAHEAADEAWNQASRATGYANDALTQLSTVESVVDTLNWITEHGTMTLTTDTAIDPTHVYFVVDANGDYIVGNTHYRLITEPKVEDLSTYYVLTIDEAVSNYVASHLALTDDGLYVVKDNQGYKVLLANDGLKVYDNGGHLVATFGENITFDAERPQKIGNNSTYVKFYDSNNDRVADKIEISGAVNITDSVTIGGKAQADYLNSNLEIGGRNLLRGSQKMDAWGLGSTASLNTSGEYGVATITVPTDNTWTSYVSSQPTLDVAILNGKSLRFSFEYTLSKNTTVSISLSGSNASPNSTGTITRTKYLGKYQALSAASTWAKFTIDMPTTVAELTSGSGDVNSIYVQISNYLDSTATMKVRKFKLEYGNTSTDWSPAPEDTASTATGYITDIDSKHGITIKPADSSGNDYLQMNSTDIRFLRNNVDVMNLTDSAFRIGSASSGHSTVRSDGLHVYTGAESTATNHIAAFGETARLGVASTGHVRVSSTGLNVWVGEETTATNNVAAFGATCRIGGSSTGHVRVSSTGLNVWLGEETTASNSVAVFGSTVRVGRSSTRHIEVKDGGLQVYQDASVVMAHIGYGSGNGTGGTDTQPYYTLGKRNGTSASDIGNWSISEGYNTKASGFASHAEGVDTHAYNAMSHAEGYGTIAAGAPQTVVGQYNVQDGTSFFIVGNGSSSSRSNAAIVDRSGNLRLKGDVYAGCNDDSTGGAPLTRFYRVSWGSSVTFDCQTTHKFIVFGDESVWIGTVYTSNTAFNKVASKTSSTESFTYSRSGTTITVTKSSDGNFAILIL